MSKFKPGDWVVNTTTDNYCDGIRNWFQLKEADLIFKQEVNAAEWEANFAFVNCHEIWQPKVGEWIQCEYASGYRTIAKVMTETTIAKDGMIYSTTLDKNWQPWKPRVDEWVVVADDITPDLYAVFQFNNHSTDRQMFPLAFLQSLKGNS